MVNPLVDGQTIIDDHQVPRLPTQALLACDAGHLVEHQIDDRPYCILRLCVIKLLPHEQYELMIQQSGWLIIHNISYCITSILTMYFVYFAM
jgi:hypothetical protein